MSRAAFFFGAGISKASGMPLAPTITHAALAGQWHLHTDKNFYPGLLQNPISPDTVTPVVQQFLGEVSSIATDYILQLARTPTPRKPHYEDLFSLAYQASRPEVDDTPNLAVVEFFSRLRTQTQHLHTGFNSPTGGNGLAGLAKTACHFLHWVVYHMLTIGAQSRSGLDTVTDVANQVDELDIFTLNHDVLVEDQCEAKGIAFEDGFADRRGELRAYSGWPEKTVRRYVSSNSTVQ